MEESEKAIALPLKCKVDILILPVFKFARLLGCLMLLDLIPNSLSTTFRLLVQFE